MSISSCTVFAGKSGGTISTSCAVPTNITGSKIAHRIETLVRRDGDVDRERLRAEVQRVAVGRRLRGLRRADIAAGAGAVLDHDLLAPHLAELLADDARQRVERAAGAEGDHHAHGFVGVGLGSHGGRHAGHDPDDRRSSRDQS